MSILGCNSNFFQSSSSYSPLTRRVGTKMLSYQFLGANYQPHSAKAPSPDSCGKPWSNREKSKCGKDKSNVQRWTFLAFKVHPRVLMELEKDRDSLVMAYTTATKPLVPALSDAHASLTTHEKECRELHAENQALRCGLGWSEGLHTENSALKGDFAQARQKVFTRRVDARNGVGRLPLWENAWNL
ncbi:uncharacterized protein G2W53_000770 [Senna tora]|uniref:Uncharacterized protein n=1 Tax=Senna tora TaxID=362788 RepID=A0A834XEC0_9FABA|nr:uncharacterized protein G2W53_000770 [Senna tora]